MSFKRIRKPEALKRFIEGKPFYLCPCKLYPSSPWNVVPGHDNDIYIHLSELPFEE